MAALSHCLSLALLLALLPGCANTPGEPGLDRPASSDPAVIQQAKADRAACIGEATTAEAKSKIKSKFSFDDAYDGCMAKRGYTTTGSIRR